MYTEREKQEEEKFERDTFRIGVTLATVAALGIALGAVFTFARIANEFKAAKIANDASIAESTKRIAEAFDRAYPPPEGHESEPQSAHLSGSMIGGCVSRFHHGSDAEKRFLAREDIFVLGENVDALSHDVIFYWRPK